MMLKEYESLRGPYDRDKLIGFFATRPLDLAARAVDFSRAYSRIAKAWAGQDDLPVDQRTRGAKLREELAALGPVAVKFGQTLSQRPDILPDDVCEDLKTLQMGNAAFDNAEAWRVLSEELCASGAPLAPGSHFAELATDPAKRPIFSSISREPVAAASLGQVYRGTTHGGVDVAIKVQRPDALRKVALDLAVGTLLGEAIVGLGIAFQDKDLDVILATVADGIFQELDYRVESQNADRFRTSMEFLGYVDGKCRERLEPGRT